MNLAVAGREVDVDDVVANRQLVFLRMPHFEGTGMAITRTTFNPELYGKSLSRLPPLVQAASTRVL